jgi:hypothetical protein
MGRWELWEGEGTTSLFPDWNIQARQMAEAEGLTSAWEVEARGTNPAMRALYDHLGFGEFQPMLGDDGAPCPDDEDENWIPEAGG